MHTLRSNLCVRTLYKLGPWTLRWPFQVIRLWFCIIWVIVLKGPLTVHFGFNFLTDGLMSSSSTLWYNVEFIVYIMIARFPISKVKYKQKIKILWYCFTVGKRFFFSKAEWFLPNEMFELYVNSSVHNTLYYKFILVLDSIFFLWSLFLMVNSFTFVVKSCL